MSDRQNLSDKSFREGQAPSQPSFVEHKASTMRDMYRQSPSKYDIDFYQRKVNRLQNDLTSVQDQLSMVRFRLTKAEDFQIKYDSIFKQNQDLFLKLDALIDENTAKVRQCDILRNQLDESKLSVKILLGQVEVQKKTNQQVKKVTQQARQRSSQTGEEEKAVLEETFIKQINTLKNEFRQKEEKLNNQIKELNSSISSKDNTQTALKFKLSKNNDDKNEQIRRIQELVQFLKKELTASGQLKNEKLVEYRNQLINQTQSRIGKVRILAQDIEECLMEEIRNLNLTLEKKNNQIEFLLEADHKLVTESEQIQKGLKHHIKRLQDKIFIIQRQNELQLFKTIERLNKQYQQNINSINIEFNQISQTNIDQLNQIQKELENCKKDRDLLSIENKKVQEKHKKLANDKQTAVKMLSQKIIKLQSEKDVDLKNYTTSMKNIEDDAKQKLKDLSSAIQSKNTQFQILTAQLKLKNEEISFLLDEINGLRNENREKIRKLETINALEQNTLNDLMSNFKKQIMQLKSKVHELQSQIIDRQAQAEMRINLMRQDLNSQKQANEMLKSKNNFLHQWCQQLQKDLKLQRVSNVNILHDQNITRRETVQMREKVWVQMQAIKNKEIDKIKSIFKLEKGRLESDLLTKEHQLREKKEELTRLLVQYKKLQNKVGKPSKQDKGGQEGKCRATLEAEILLTENIFNAINQS